MQPCSRRSIVRLLETAILTTSLLLLVTATSVFAAQTDRASSFVQAATGSLYWQNEQTEQWIHRDTAEISAGHRFGRWLDTEVTWWIRTDVSTGLTLDTRLRLLRLGPANLRLKALGSIGTGLDGDIWVSRMVAAGPQFELQLPKYTLTAYGIAGFHEKSAWHFNNLTAPFAEAGATLKPSHGLSGIVANASYTVKESPVSEKPFEGSWNGSVGFRWAL